MKTLWTWLYFCIYIIPSVGNDFLIMFWRRIDNMSPHEVEKLMRIYVIKPDTVFADYIIRAITCSILKNVKGHISGSENYRGNAHAISNSW